VECGYLKTEKARELHKSYNNIIGKLVNMINNPSPWLLSRQID